MYVIMRWLSSTTLFPYTTLFRSRSRRTFAAAFLVCCLTLSWSALGQITISDNFDSGFDTGWTHYAPLQTAPWNEQDRKSTRLNSSHRTISYAVFCLKKKNKI